MQYILSEQEYNDLTRSQSFDSGDITDFGIFYMSKKKEDSDEIETSPHLKINFLKSGKQSTIFFSKGTIDLFYKTINP